MQRMLEYIYTFLFFVSSNVSKIKCPQQGEKDFKGGYAINYSRYSTNVETINQSELKRKKETFFSEAKEMEKGTFGTLHDYLNLGQVGTYLINWL